MFLACSKKILYFPTLDVYNMLKFLKQHIIYVDFGISIVCNIINGGGDI